MISVVIATLNDERTLGQTLGSLVHAAVDGLVREVILADGGSADATLEIADDAGARIVRGDIAEAARTARADWLLILDVAAPAPHGWEEAAAAQINASGDGLWWGEAPLLGKRKIKGLLTPRRVYEAGAGFARAKRVKF